MVTNQQVLYTERLTSNRTLALFAGLAVLFGGAAYWLYSRSGSSGWTAILTCFSLFFLFYVINYRTLRIQLTSRALTLKFGIFRWQISLNNIADCRLDDIQGVMYYSGAGIHFMTIAHRYRASFNFLEYPRVVIAFQSKIGPVQDISFSTQQPEELIRQINTAAETFQST